METLPLLQIKILQHLSTCFSAGCTLEELALVMAPDNNTRALITGDNWSRAQRQARVLDVLLVLNQQSHIFIDPFTDKSTITFKGLIILKSKIICN